MGGPRFEQLFRATGRLARRRRRARAPGRWPPHPAPGRPPARARSAATSGSRRCSRAGVPSASSLPAARPTASRRSTRASSSTATARSSRRGSSTRPGCAGSSRRGRTCRSCSRPTTARTTTIGGETALSTFMVMPPEVGGGLLPAAGDHPLHVGRRAAPRHARALHQRLLERTAERSACRPTTTSLPPPSPTTGLDDFGDDSFREGLEILVRALRDEADLNAAGEAVLYPRIVDHLGQRLQVEDWYRRHPEIDDVDDRARRCSASGCRAPVPPRCRSCSREDPGVRSLRMWESGAPCPPPSTVEGDDPRIAADGRRRGRRSGQSRPRSTGRWSATS